MQAICIAYETCFLEQEKGALRKKKISYKRPFLVTIHKIFYEKVVNITMLVLMKLVTFIFWYLLFSN